MSKTLATVNGKVITEADLDFLLSTLPPQQAAMYANPEARKGILEELIAHELFYFDAQERHLDQEEGFQRELEIAKEKLLKSYSIASMLRQVSIKDEDIKDYYENNAPRFQESQQYHAKHILVDTQEEHDEILARLQQGEDFSQLAKEHSTCPSKDQGGDLGTFSQGQMVQEFDEALAAMDIGEVKGNVKTTYGYHIIELLDKKMPRTIPFEEVQGKIHSYLLTNAQNDLFVKKVNSLKEKYSVDYASEV